MEGRFNQMKVKSSFIILQALILPAVEAGYLNDAYTGAFGFITRQGSKLYDEAGNLVLKCRERL